MLSVILTIKFKSRAAIKRRSDVLFLGLDLPFRNLLSLSTAACDLDMPIMPRVSRTPE